VRLYLDDDSAARQLTELLRKAGHDVVTPIEVGIGGAADPIHFTYAISHGLTLMTRNHADFEALHHLVLAAGGGHPGILLRHSDNDPTRDLSFRGVVTAIGKLLASGVPIADELHVMSHWR